MQNSLIKPKTFIGKFLIFIGIAAGYFLLGLGGLQLAIFNQNAGPVWPASGFGIGCLLIFGPRMAPAIYLAGALVNATTDTPAPGVLLVALGNMLEAMAGHYLVKSLLKIKLYNTYSELVSISMTSIIASIISATIGIFSLTLVDVIPESQMFGAWYTWWSGDVLGILIILPLLLVIYRKNIDWNPNWKNHIVGFVILILMTTGLYLVFVKGYNQAFVWSLTPLLLIAGVIFGNFFSRILHILLCSYLFYLTTKGYGPFEQGNMLRNLLYVQSLIASYSIAVLFVSPLKTNYRIPARYLIGIIFGWISVFIAIHAITSYERNQTLQDFSRTANSAVQSLKVMARQYDLLLEGVSAVLSVNPSFTENDWQNLLTSADPQRYSDFINSLGVVKIFDNNKLKDFETSEKIQIKLIDPEFADHHENHYIVAHYKSFYGDLNFKGLDIGSEVNRRIGANRSKEKNETVLVGPVKFVHYKDKPEAFLIFNPIFLKETKFYGWTYASIYANDFFQKPLSQFSYLLETKIKINGKEVYQPRIDKSLSFFEGYKESPFYLTEKIELLGNVFELEFYPSDLFFKRHSGYSAPLALLLNLFILFISGFLLQQLTFQQTAKELVEKRTKELELSKIQLIQSSKMASLGEMASGMAHEINNPLTIIQGKTKVLAMLLEDNNINNPLLLSEIEKIQITTDRIGKIVKGLRNFSRVSVNDPFEYFPLDKLILETLDLCSERFKADGIDLRIESIPEHFIKCRPAEISQVLINLLNNSSDALQNHSVKWIELTFKKLSGTRLLLSITDSGPGIPEEISDRIMEPFFTTKDVRKGTGLGLSISKGIVESHGGVLRLDKSHPYTRFLLDLEYCEDPLLLT